MEFGKKDLSNQVISDINFNIYVMKLKRFLEFIKEDVDINVDVDGDIDQVKRKFVKYVNTLPAFVETNEERYKDESEGSENYDEDDEHSYTLFKTWGEPVFDDVIGEYISIDDSIEYFIMGWYYDDNTNSTEFHVYDNGEFRESGGNEDHFFRTLDDTMYLGNQDNVMSITYDDWKIAKEKAVKSVLKINEE